ncbi:efflux RND transporter periplasmic adaptor subunit [bacterium]|nr:MAG: efflux RND transporter periplasmic adaptor subunit [bacterium]
MRDQIVVGIAILALGIGASGCRNTAAQEQAKQTQAITGDTTVVVETAPATIRPIAEELEITGQIATSADTQVSAKQGGRLVAIYVKDGDPVTAGQVLAEVESTTLLDQLAQAEAQAANTRAQLLSSRAQLTQQIRNAAISPQRSQGALGQAQAGLRSAKAQLQKALNGARPQERAQAQAQLDQARTNLETQRIELKRVETLVQEGAIAGNRLDQQRNTLAQAESAFRTATESLGLLTSGTRQEDISVAREAVRQAEEGVKSAQATRELDATLRDQVDAARANVSALQASLRSSEAQIRIARQNLEDAKIRAPFAGRVNGQPAQVGQVVAPGTLVVQLVGQGASYFEGTVPEGQFSRMSVGLPVQVQITAINRTVSGKIAALAPQSSSIGRQFTARVELAERPAGIAPGMFASGTVTLRTVPNATVVPVDVVVSSGDKDYVVVAEGDTAKRYPVTLGIRKDRDVQVTGLPVGAQIVVRGQATLNDGAKIRIEKPKGTDAGSAVYAPDKAGEDRP